MQRAKDASYASSFANSCVVATNAGCCAVRLLALLSSLSFDLYVVKILSQKILAGDL